MTQGTPASELERFGSLYTNRAGQVYLRCPGQVGKRADRLRVFAGRIEGVAAEGAWWCIQVTGLPETFAVHQNWINLHDELKLGEDIEGLLDVPEGKAWYLRRVTDQTKATKVDEVYGSRAG